MGKGRKKAKKKQNQKQQWTGQIVSGSSEASKERQDRPETEKVEGKAQEKPEAETAEGKVQEKPKAETAEGKAQEKPEAETAEGKVQEKPEAEAAEGKVQEKPKAETAEGKAQEKPEAEAAEGKVQEKPEAETKAKSEAAAEAEAEKTEKGFPWKKAGVIFAGSVAGILLVVYAAGMIYLRDKFQPNTTINGIEASFDTVEEAEQKIADMVERYAINLEERDGSVETITAKQVGYHYVSKGEIQGFKKSQKLYLWPVYLWKDSEYQFASSTTFDEEQLKETVSALKCFDKSIEIAPTDAYMKFNGTTYEMVKETQGKKVRKKKLIKVLNEAISKSENEISLETEGCYAKPKITEKNRLLNKKIKNLNSYAKTRIVYKFGGEQELLDGSIVSKWLSCDENGEVTLDEEKVALYVDYLADEYDTSGRPRDFVTHGGTTVKVEGGNYGWLIDREAETAELTEMIRAGKRRTRIPVYARTAVSRENSDLGDSYVEVDLSGQHLWMYVDGEEIVSTDVVSGTYTNASRRTPAGTYTLYYKKSPAVLRSNTPGDSYENPVTYWMPFNGGIGLHDANWRGSFGGTIYKYSGSHGCINLPTSAAREIYNNIYAGMPIICYY